MATRQFYYAESTAESTDLDTTGVYADKTTLTFTPDASSTYYLIASWYMQQLTSTIRYVAGNLIESGTPTTYQEIIHDTHDTTGDYYAGGGLGIFTEGASPASRTFKIQVKGENNAVSEKIKNARLLAIKKHASDQHVEQTTRQTTVSTTYVDVSGTSLTFTPATTGDYIIIAMAQADVSTASRAMGILVNIDGVTYGETAPAVQDGALNKYPFFFVKKVNLSSASHTIKLQFKSDSAAVTLGLDKIRIIALRADTFDNVYYDEETTRATTTSTSYTDTSVSITQTPQAADHFILASGVIDSSSATQNMGMKLLEGASDIGELYMEPKLTTSKYGFFAMYEKDFTAASTTWKLQYRAETSNTVGYDEAAIAVIQLESSGPPPVTQTITGKSRITATTTRTQTGKARVTATTTKTQTGKARVANVVPRTQTGVSRITAVTPRTQQGKARVSQEPAPPKLQTGLARVEKAVTQTVQGKAKVETPVPRTTTGVARITAVTSQGITGKAAVQNTTSKTVTGKSRIEKSATQTVQGKARIQTTGLQTQSGKSRITATNSSTTTGKGRITATTLQTQTGKARVQVSASQTITGKSRVEATTGQTTTGVANIAAASVVASQTTTGKARIQKAVDQTQTGKARVENSATRTVSGKSRIAKVETPTLSGVSRITVVTSANTSGKAAVQGTTLRTTTGTSRIVRTVQQTISGLSRIQTLVQQPLLGRARITATVGQNQTGKANIAPATITTQKTITGKAKILSTISKPSSSVILLVNGSAAVKVGSNLYMPV